VAYAENFRGEDKFRHNRVTSQINLRTTILGGPGARPRKNFAKLHLKIRKLHLKYAFTPKSTHTIYTFFLLLGSDGAPWHSAPPFRRLVLPGITAYANLLRLNYAIAGFCLWLVWCLWLFSLQFWCLCHFCTWSVARLVFLFVFAFLYDNHNIWLPFSLFFSITKFQARNFIFSSLHDNTVEENIMHQQLQKMYGEEVFRSNSGKYRQNILCIPNKLPAPTPMFPPYSIFHFSALWLANLIEQFDIWQIN